MMESPEEKDENVFFYLHTILELEAIYSLCFEMRSVGLGEIKGIGKVRTQINTKARTKIQRF